jgi:hypothetical protein
MSMLLHRIRCDVQRDISYEIRSNINSQIIIIIFFFVFDFNYALQIGCRFRLDSGYQPPRALRIMLFRHCTKLPTERIEIKSLVVPIQAGNSFPHHRILCHCPTSWHRKASNYVTEAQRVSAPLHVSLLAPEMFPRNP